MPVQSFIVTPFGADSTAAQVVAGIDLGGRRAIVTGASSGIGVETARALAGAGAEVTLAVRDVAAGERVAEQIGQTTGDGAAVHVGALDLSDQASVAAFVADWSGPLDILVNNAGVMAIPTLQRTPEGWELQFATNHLGHFALARGLHGALAAAGGARIVSLSSRGHAYSPILFDDVNFTTPPYDPAVAYGQSKTANVLFAVEASRRWADDGITANAVHPGAILDSGLARHMTPEALEVARTSGRYMFKTPAQGAATSVLVATSPLLDGVGGRYFADCNERPVVHTEGGVDIGGSAVADFAVDPDNAARLWEVSERLLAG